MTNEQKEKMFEVCKELFLAPYNTTREQILLSQGITDSAAFELAQEIKNDQNINLCNCVACTTERRENR